ncbi:hypothetical protein J3458_013484 [Metarhizium acridum]|uniref:uncharacterized protein n=1 Tax=Metarhizium acridum TaxID=92637 RepID=UPI001C6BA64F|nr:hypothetical protein J3458_013484 [Metarhizium acridum]
MTRKICITAVDGNTGFAIAELLLQHREFSRKIESVIGLALEPKSEKAQELKDSGATIVPHTFGRVRDMVKTLKDTGADTICLVPPAHKDKHDICVELVDAAKKAQVANVCLISSAGCDYADPKKQPRLREFIDLEALVLQSKGDASTPTGGSPCVIRAGFYAENLLLYAPQAQEEGILPLPIGKSHKFAPVALGDVAHVAAHVLTGKGKHGFDDKHRGQMMIVTGPKLCAGHELATAASKALDTEMEFENISQAEAKRVLKAQSDSDQSELQYLLEYYSLVREGKTNYIATTAFHDVTGGHPTEPDEFFRLYQNEFRPSKKAKHSHNHK